MWQEQHATKVSQGGVKRKHTTPDSMKRSAGRSEGAAQTDGWDGKGRVLASE